MFMVQSKINTTNVNSSLRLTFCFGVGEAVSRESEEAGLEIFNTKLLSSLGSLDHEAKNQRP